MSGDLREPLAGILLVACGIALIIFNKPIVARQEVSNRRYRWPEGYIPFMHPIVRFLCYLLGLMGIFWGIALFLAR
jgi:hypothetical protein